MPLTVDASSATIVVRCSNGSLWQTFGDNSVTHRFIDHANGQATEIITPLNGRKEEIYVHLKGPLTVKTDLTCNTLNMGMSSVPTSEIPQWLLIRLGNSEKAWVDGSIAPYLTKELLKGIYDCFLELQNPIKIKLLLSFMHIVRRSVDTLRPELEAIVELAIKDLDQWVSLTAEFLKYFPSKGEFNLNIVAPNNSVMYNRMRNDIKKHLKRLSDRQPDMTLVPQEAEFMNKKAFTSSFGNVAAPVKHFTLKQKPKSATLRADALAKSSESGAKPRSQAGNSLPIRFKDQIKSMDSIMAGGSQAPTPAMKRAFAAGPQARVQAAKEKQATTAKARGGVKMLDITEQPMGLEHSQGSHKRRRKLVGVPVGGEKKEEEAKEEKVEEEVVPEGTDKNREVGTEKNESPAAGEPTGSTVQSPAPTSPLSAASRPPDAKPSPVYPISPDVSPQRQSTPLSSSPTPTLSPPRIFPQSPPRTPTIVPPISSLVMPAPQQYSPTLSPHSSPYQPLTSPHSSPVRMDLAGAGPSRPPVIVPPPPGTQIVHTLPSALMDTSSVKITREVQNTITELFANANRVTRPEKVLIGRFIAGDRKNPWPHVGPILTVRLSENPSTANVNGRLVNTIVEEYFHMNFDTGEWKRLRKQKPVSPAKDAIPSGSPPAGPSNPPAPPAGSADNSFNQPPIG